MRVFEETQRFNQWWLWLLLIVAFIAILFEPIQGMMESGNFTDYHFNHGFWIGFLVFVLAIVFLGICTLHTEIDENGIAYRFFPFHTHTQRIDWNAIEHIAVVQYNPIMEYGGWGYRMGPKGKVCNIRGNKGIQIVFKQGQKLLIGTQRPKEAGQVIKKYFKHEGI